MRWASHPDFPDYKISEDCTVVRIVDSTRHKTGTISRGRVTYSGYRQFKLVSKDGTQKEVRAARLLLEAFVGPAPSHSHQAAHNDGVRLNNHIDNLRWATPKENSADKVLHGTRQIGERSARAVFTDAQVLAMRAEYTGLRGDYERLARKYGASRSLVAKVIRGESFGHLPRAKPITRALPVGVRQQGTRFRSSSRKGGKLVNLGFFKTVEEAEAAYNNYSAPDRRSRKERHL